MPVQFTTDSLPINQGEIHIPVVILVDISDFMIGEPTAELNRGLTEFGITLGEDALTMGRAEACIISFNSSIQTEMEFRPAEQYQAPVLSAGGRTSLNVAIEAGLDAIENRKRIYKSHGIRYYRPWLFVLTAGVPTDRHKEGVTMSRLKNAIENKKVVYIPMGIGPNADIKKLQEYYPETAKAKPVLKAEANAFKEAFVWLSTSISQGFHSDPTIASEIMLLELPSGITIGIS